MRPTDAPRTARRDYLAAAPFIVSFCWPHGVEARSFDAFAQAVAYWWMRGSHPPSATHEGNGPLRRYVIDARGMMVLGVQHESVCDPLDQLVCTEQASNLSMTLGGPEAVEGLEQMEMAAIARDVYLEMMEQP